jgi:hypothetical protein
VRQYAWLFRDIKNRNVEDIVILSGDHLYRMDYMKVPPPRPPPLSFVQGPVSAPREAMLGHSM